MRALAAAILIAALAACSSTSQESTDASETTQLEPAVDVHEALIIDQVALLEDMAILVEAVDSPEKARELRPQFEEVGVRAEAMKLRMAEVGAPPAEKELEIKEKYGPTIEGLMIRMIQSAENLAAYPELQAELRKIQ